MANILKFVIPAGRAERSPRARKTGTTCEIVIFPGVRYERWQDGEKPKSQPKRSRKRRARAR